MSSNLKLSKIQCQKGLPICEKWDEIKKAILKNQVLIVTGETGSGKTTQLPKLCLSIGLARKGIIGCCQPRRIAAVSVANRVSKELSHIAQVVGYKIRFQFKLPANCKIKFMTDGILLSELQSDPHLSAYSTIILDEAHERSINIDLIAGMLKLLLKKRKDLKVIITSATMEVERFKEFFSAPVIKIKGRTFPVKIIYERDDWYNNLKDTDISQKVSRAVELIRDIDKRGDILVFLPTEKDILNAKKALTLNVNCEDALILPLFARLSSKEQSKIFRPSTKQKIILATNIAETSITVPGIRYVVDSGLARISEYNPNIHIKALPVKKIPKANAQQRAGRAGRVEKGICIRLYSKEDFEEREDFLEPEIKRSSLSEVILKLLYLGQQPVEDFPFIDPPKKNAIKEGLHTLFELGAIDKKGNLTILGKKMAQMPLDPRLSRIIFQAQKEGCLPHVLVVVSALSIQDIFQSQTEDSYLDKSLFDDSSDFITLIKIWNRLAELKEKGISKNQVREFCHKSGLSFQKINQWKDVLNQLLKICFDLKLIKNKEVIKQIETKKLIIDESTRIFIHRSLLCGFLGHIANKKERMPSYLGTKGKEVFIHPSSCLFKKGISWIVSAEQIKTSKLFARVVAPINPEWIEEFAPYLLKFSYFDPHWDKERGEAIVYESVNFYGLRIISRRKKSLKIIDKKEARRLLIKEGLSKCELNTPYPFNEHNKKILEEIESLVKKHRYNIPLIDETLVEEFFENALSELEEETSIKIVDEKTLNLAIRKSKNKDKSLFLEKELLLEKGIISTSDTLYPGHIEIDGQSLPLVYHFSPGSKEDGITLKVPLILLNILDENVLEFLVPGFLQEKIEFILKRLPKKYRQNLKPYEKSAEKILFSLSKNGDFFVELKNALNSKFNINVELDLLRQQKHILPTHLKMRIEVFDQKGKILFSTREIENIKYRYIQMATNALEEFNGWRNAQKNFQKKISNIKELDKITTENKIQIGKYYELPIYVYLGLLEDNKRVFIAPFLSKSERIKNSQRALTALLEEFLKKEIKFLKKSIHKDLEEVFLKELVDLKFEKELLKKELQGREKDIYLFIREKLFPSWSFLPNSNDLLKEVQKTKMALLRSSNLLLDPILEFFSNYAKYKKFEQKAILKLKTQPLGKRVTEEIELIKKELLESYPLLRSDDFLKSSPRFMWALKLRLERAINNPQKDLEKNKLFKPTFLTYLQIKKKVSINKFINLSSPSLDYLIFEYMTMIFSPEHSKKGITSQKKLTSLLEEIKETV